MKTFYQRVMDSLEKDKENYRYIFYDLKKNRLYFVKSMFLLMPKKIKYLDYYDGKLFGKHIPVSRCENWIYIGKGKFKNE